MKVIKTILVQLFTGANVATILLLWACCGVTYLHPGLHPRLTLMSLLFPAFVVGNLLFVFFWLVFKVKRVWIPIVGFVACGSFLRDYLPVNLPSKGAVDSTITILSYNSHSYGMPESVEDGTNRVFTYLATSDVDIICLQESSNKPELSDEMEKKGYSCVSKKEFTLYSRLPILDSDTLALEGEPCHALRAYLQDGKDTLLLLSVHLQSNKLSPEMKQAYREAIERHERDSMRKDLSPIVQLLTKASPLRAAQADSLAAIVEAWLPRPVIVCGDFNDTPVSYTHRLLTRRLTSAFRESGNGLGFTYHEKGFPVRIDHILFDGEKWKSCRTSVENDIRWSDHFPIRTRLIRKTP